MCGKTAPITLELGGGHGSEEAELPEGWRDHRGMSGEDYEQFDSPAYVAINSDHYCPECWQSLSPEIKKPILEELVENESEFGDRENPRYNKQKQELHELDWGDFNREASREEIAWRRFNRFLSRTSHKMKSMPDPTTRQLRKHLEQDHDSGHLKEMDRIKNQTGYADRYKYKSLTAIHMAEHYENQNELDHYHDVPGRMTKDPYAEIRAENPSGDPRWKKIDSKLDQWGHSEGPDEDPIHRIPRGTRVRALPDFAGGRNIIGGWVEGELQPFMEGTGGHGGTRGKPWRIRTPQKTEIRIDPSSVHVPHDLTIPTESSERRDLLRHMQGYHGIWGQDPDGSSLRTMQMAHQNAHNILDMQQNGQGYAPDADYGRPHSHEGEHVETGWGDLDDEEDLPLIGGSKIARGESIAHIICDNCGKKEEVDEDISGHDDPNTDIIPEGWTDRDGVPWSEKPFEGEEISDWRHGDHYCPDCNPARGKPQWEEFNREASKTSSLGCDTCGGDNVTNGQCEDCVHGWHPISS